MTPAPIRRIPRLSSLCAEQIECRYKTEEQAVLVDQFGCTHRLAATTVIGREPDKGLAILETSVSRIHAEISLASGIWMVRDRNSTNGTFLDGHRVSDNQEISSNQLLVLGDVGFLFYADHEAGMTIRATESIRATVASDSLLGSTLYLCEPSGGGGGHAEYEEQSVQMGIMQYALLETLANRFLKERHNPDDVRGFVPSSELLADLPWNTPYPGDNNIKQLVRRVRRALEQIALTDAIESRQRFGYRLRVEPGFR